jgi:hypothetical protein
VSCADDILAKVRGHRLTGIREVKGGSKYLRRRFQIQIFLEISEDLVFPLLTANEIGHCCQPWPDWPLPPSVDLADAAIGK